MINIVEFLTGLHKKGLGYSAINTAKSAISSFVYIVSNVQVGNHILIKQYMKGIFHLRPALPKYNYTWSVSNVLKSLACLYPLEELSLKQLSMKLVTLLALTTGQRCQTLYYMDLHNICLSHSFVKIRIGDLLKNTRVGKHLDEIFIAAYPEKKLCVLETLKRYIDVTKNLRGDVTKLFISVQKPHKMVTKSTIARWIKETLAAAGINILEFTAHSTRGASTSAAAGKVPIDTILRTAGWTKDCVFRKFYKRPVLNDSDYSNSILDMGT